MSAPGERLGVLYVDDDEAVRRLAQIRLGRKGWAVDVADDGDVALEKLKQGDYDLVVVDYRMPRMDGLAVLRAMGREEWRMPVIVATAVGDEKVAVEAMKLGAGDYLVKDLDGGFLDLVPTIYERLRSTLRLVAEREQADSALRASEHRYRQIVETAQEAIWTVDREGVTTFVNRRALTMLGYPEGRMLGRPLLEFVDEDYVVRVTKALDTHRRGRSVRTSDLALRHANGMVVWVIAASSILRDAAGEFAGSMLMLTDITERKWTEEALRKSEEKYRSIIDTAAEGYWLLHPETWVTIEVNRALCSMLGYQRSELLGKTPLGLADEENRKVLEEQCDRIPTTDHRAFEVTLQAKDGLPVHARFSSTTVRDITGTPTHTFAFVTDISDQKKAEENLRLAAKVYQTTTEGIMVTDAAWRIKAVNPAFTRITGYSEQEVVGRSPGILDSGRHDREFMVTILRDLKENGSWQGEIWNRRKGGEVFPEWLSVSVVRDSSGDPAQYVSVFSDITGRKEAEEIIRRQANFDPLTELPNRTLFTDRLSRAVGQASRHGHRGALMFLDLDRFKGVNDSFGHRAGDLLLQEAARRLSGTIRESDTVARFGGDEFTVILPEIQRPSDAEIVAKKIIGSLGEAFPIDSDEAYISASVGITLFPDDGADPEELLRNADWAMYKAKESGGRTFRFFTQEMDTQALARMQLEGELRRGLDRGELVVHYQPIIDIRTGTLAKAEALVRWHHPERGMMPPAEFIPLAEATGLIVPLGEWVLRDVCLQLRAWMDMGCAPDSVAVNLSSRQFTGQKLEEMVLGVLEETGLSPLRIDLEITESILLDNAPETIRGLRTLMEQGIHFSIDDFGTGYSSLGYLKRFPFDILKIDQVFVGDVTSNPDDATLARTIIAMAHGLGLKAVAEGVETAEQLAFLAAQDCDYAQGYYFSPPVAADRFITLLRKDCEQRRGYAAE